MLLCYRHRFLFVHIAKTGGTSVRRALGPERWKDRYRIALFLCSRLSAMTGHRLGVKFPRHAKAVAAKEMLPRELFGELFKFAFVRNPWDLQVSSYHHIRRERPHLMDGIEGFPSFIRWKLNPGRPYHYIVDTSMELQSDYLRDLSGDIIVDYVGRYESLQEDFDEVCRRIGIPRRDLPRLREATDRRAYRSYYDDQTAELVANHFRADIETLGYSF
jgi:Sulfotransferase family